MWRKFEVWQGAEGGSASNKGKDIDQNIIYEILKELKNIFMKIVWTEPKK